MNTKKNLGRGMTTLIMPNEEVRNIARIVKSLEESGLLIKGVNKTIKIEVKEQKDEILSMSLGTLGDGLLGYLLAGKELISAGEGMIRAL